MGTDGKHILCMREIPYPVRPRGLIPHFQTVGSAGFELFISGRFSETGCKSLSTELFQRRRSRLFGDGCLGRVWLDGQCCNSG